MRLTLYTLFGVIIADGLLTNFLVTNGYGLELNPFLKAWVGQDIFLTIFDERHQTVVFPSLPQSSLTQPYHLAVLGYKYQ